jgi:transcription antitermination factor NusG
MLTIDYGQIELKVMGRMMEIRQAQWNQIRKFPGILSFVRLRKSRARMMADAVRLGAKQEKGNFAVRMANSDSSVFMFSYRETDIVAWNPGNERMVDIDAGEFEHTSSTRNQRKLIREAIGEFRRTVIG